MTQEREAMGRRTGTLALATLATAGGAAAVRPAAAQGAPQAVAGAGGGFTAGQRAEIVAILRDAMVRDPSILRDAILAMRSADESETARRRRALVRDNAEALFRDPADPVKGNPQGDVTVVEFFDARCGYCKSMVPVVQALLAADPRIRLVMKDLPILGPNSVLASRALLAAHRQNRYVPLYDALMTLRGDTTEAAIQAEAARAGLDWPRLRREMNDPAIEQRIGSHLRLAQTLGIEGTPAFVIGDSLLPGAADLATLQGMVAQARRAG